jgi:hypothetical protein
MFLLNSHVLLQQVTAWSAVLVRCTLSWVCATSVWTVCATTCVRPVFSWAGLARGTSWGTQCRNTVLRQVWHMLNYRQWCKHIWVSDMSSCDIWQTQDLNSHLHDMNWPVIKEAIRDYMDRLGYRSGGPGSIPGTTRKKKVVGSGTGSTQPREYNWGATW